jgi:WD40 repeat protein
MKQSPFFTSVFISALLFLAACTPPISISTLPPAPTEGPAATPALSENPSPGIVGSPESPPSSGSLLVAFVKDGDIHLWEEATGQSWTLIKAGDVTSVTLSDDGQVIAFMRRALVEQPELMEYVSLWAVDRDGKNPRELVSAESLRQRLHPGASDSVGFGQVSWIPDTHRLVYSGSKYYLPGQGSTYSKDIYVVDADTGADTVLAPDVMPDTFVNDWRFVISPDGGQIALFNNTTLSLMSVDGSNRHQAVLTYPAVGGGDAILLPYGVWKQDSSAFLFTGPGPSESMFVLNYTVWRVPTDASSPQSLATLTDSHSSYVSFSPDGKQIAFYQDMNGDRTIQATDYRIMPLGADVGPLARPNRPESSGGDLHWSPAGEAFVMRDGDLFRLCPGATQASEVCGEPIDLGDPKFISSIQWLDGQHFLFTGLEPATLSLAGLDSTITPILTANDGEWSSWSAVLAR